MSDVAMAISCKIDGVIKSFLLENIEDVPVNDSSTISRHPIPTGEYVSDTMYKEPVIVNVNGVFSMNGKKGLVMDETGKLSLEDIQNFFTRIKNEGVLCDLVKVRTVDNNSPQFKSHRSMALQSISWTEKINSLGFGFTFQQVMQVNISEYDVDETDSAYPDVEEPKTLNFTESLFNQDQIVSLLVTILNENNLIEQGFLEKFRSYDPNELSKIFENESSISSLDIGLIAGVSYVSIVTLIIGIGVVTGAVTGGVSTILAIAAVIGIGIAIGVKALVDYFRSKISKFKVYKNEKKMKKECVRFLELFLKIYKEFSILNQQIAVYQISSNKAQQCILSIEDDYYCFTFTRNNTNDSFDLTLLDLEGNIVSGTKTLHNIKDAAQRGLNTCNSSTAILNTNSKHQVFLLNPNENRTDDLTENYILVSGIDMGQFFNYINDIIKAYLLY